VKIVSCQWSVVSDEFNLRGQQLNWFSLQRSEMFIATSAPHQDLAPLGAKPGSETFSGAGKRDCAPTELRSEERTARL